MARYSWFLCRWAFHSSLPTSRLSWFFQTSWFFLRRPLDGHFKQTWKNQNNLSIQMLWMVAVFSIQYSYVQDPSWATWLDNMLRQSIDFLQSWSLLGLINMMCLGLAWSLLGLINMMCLGLTSIWAFEAWKAACMKPNGLIPHILFQQPNGLG